MIDQPDHPSGHPRGPDHTPEPDPGPSDDTVISKAFWRSLAVLAVIVAGVLVLFAWDSWKHSQKPVQQTTITPPQTPSNSSTLEQSPNTPFTDITAISGVDFVHYNGAQGQKLLPETMGSGVAFLDFNNDGRQDLLFSSGADWPWNKSRRWPPATPALYLNLGDGHFQNVTANSGLNISFFGTGIAIGDYDNDGRSDVFMTGVGENHLFHNEDNGRFLDVTTALGLTTSPTDWCTSATWLDYDNDGDLDLFICRYVRWSREIDIAVDYRLVGIGRAYGPPDNFPGTHPLLYRNDGTKGFTDVSEVSGIIVTNRATGAPMAKSLGVSAVDLDRDGWMDLIVANDTVQNFVFHNERNGTFREIGAMAGVAFDSYGGTRGAMGIDSARVLEEDQLAIAIGNFANEMTAFYVAQRNPLLFSDEAIGQGIGPASRLSLTFGVFFFDYDLDGWLDFLATNGHIEQEIGKVQKSQQYRQSARLFWNSSSQPTSRGFAPMPAEKIGTALQHPIVGRGSAFGDIDQDGDLDVVMTQVDGPPLILRNDQKLGHHWLRLKLVGQKSNRDAIGAMIRIQTPTRTLWRQVTSTRGYLSSSELPVTIGLGAETKLNELEIQWPSGARQTVKNLKIDSTSTITESP